MALLRILTFYILHDGIVARQIEFNAMPQRKRAALFVVVAETELLLTAHTCTCTTNENIWCKQMRTTAVQW